MTAKTSKSTTQKTKTRSKGVGDTIEKITKATGIKKVVDKISETLDVDCGCDKRKELLNKLFPYKNVECLTEDEFKYLDNYDFNKNYIDQVEQKELLKIYNRIFNDKKKGSSCITCWKKTLSELNNIYIEYKK